MYIYFSGTSSLNNLPQLVYSSKYYSQSFFSLATFVDRKKPQLLQHKNIAQKFILDSGAFTYMKGNHTKKPDWNSYIDEYCKYIVANNISQYMELDIDNIVGYDCVKEFRKIIELKTGRKSIPVWHTSRGYDEYKRMCDEYNYIAIGGLATLDIRWRSDEQIEMLTKLVNYAHTNNTKVHGLGFTSAQYLPQIHFDSIDSTTWLMSTIYGDLTYFDGTTIIRVAKKRGVHLMGELSNQQLQEFNFKQWLKFAHYAKSNL